MLISNVSYVHSLNYFFDNEFFFHFSVEYFSHFHCLANLQKEFSTSLKTRIFRYFCNEKFYGSSNYSTSYAPININPSKYFCERMSRELFFSFNILLNTFFTRKIFSLVSKTRLSLDDFESIRSMIIL